MSVAKTRLTGHGIHVIRVIRRRVRAHNIFRSLLRMGARRVCVVTDETVDKLYAMKQVREALDSEGIQYDVYNKTRIEPKDSS